jgi:mannitol/fructose-specific phosphotransferase system IIA component (Ntr-type)
MSLCPPEFNNPYLQFVSHIAGVLAKKENIAQILQAKTQQEVFQVFAGKKERV